MKDTMKDHQENVKSRFMVELNLSHDKVSVKNGVYTVVTYPLEIKSDNLFSALSAAYIHRNGPVLTLAEQVFLEQGRILWHYGDMYKEEWFRASLQISHRKYTGNPTKGSLVNLTALTNEFLEFKDK